MVLYKLFLHKEWHDTCILNNNFTICKSSNKLEYGTYNIIDAKIIIKWTFNNLFIENTFVNYYDIFYDINFYNEYMIDELTIYNFLHEEWQCFCILNNTLNIIFKKDNISEIGKYKFDTNYIDINWFKWGHERFIKINGVYYQEKIIIKNNKINHEKDITDQFQQFINYDNNKLKIENIENNLMKNIDIFNEINNIINDDIYKDEIYNNNKLSENLDIKKSEKFIKINNKFFYTKYKDLPGFIHNILDNKLKFTYITNNKDNILINNYINKFIMYNDLITNLKLINDNIITNKNYLNINNLSNFSTMFNNTDNNLFDYIFMEKFDFDISLKNKKRCLSLVEWGYPPFGGGENWLLNISKILNKNDYDNYLICFSDPFKNEYFTEYKLINLEYIKIIQMPKDLVKIIKLIKIINPEFINHQGENRILYMKISNILEIPFLTGFCFWQNIIKFNLDNYNLNMLSNDSLEKSDDFQFILNNSYNYVSSEFVNDIINKFYDTRLDVIETISIEEEFKVDYDLDDDIKFEEKKYVTLINCHYNKGGYLIKYLCENLDINIPLQFVNTENDPNITLNYITNLLDIRNSKNNINILIPSKIDIKLVYKVSRIILIPSLCEESFCRVGYEAMINKIPIISSRNGNLKYLLNNYSIFIDDFDLMSWKNEIELLYFDKNKILEFKNKKSMHNLNIDYVEKKIINKINSINGSKYKLNDKNIGIIAPWADQGLGIQARDYYITFKDLGFNPHILSFKPYHATHENQLLQSNSDEWTYENITYSDNYRENLNLDEIFNFIYNNNIKKIIIIEGTFINIFKIACFLKLLNVKIYLVVNIECIRIEELNYHNIFDKILTNNIDSHVIISEIYKNKSVYLGFHLNHHYFKYLNKNLKEDKTKIKFMCNGGLNSISRKSIDTIICVFYEIFKDNIYLNWELNVSIQGVEIPDIIKDYCCDNIKYYCNNMSYKEIVEKYLDNDIFIHMGTHEGLGLGFYESIYCGTPVLTLNWTPNNEIITNDMNGWLIDCDFGEIYDNNCSLINKAIVNKNNLKNKIINILNNEENTINIINNTIINRDNIYNKNKKIFEKKISKIFS